MKALAQRYLHIELMEDAQIQWFHTCIITIRCLAIVGVIDVDETSLYTDTVTTFAVSKGGRHALILLSQNNAILDERLGKYINAEKVFVSFINFILTCNFVWRL